MKQTVLLTGGTSGIGYELARLFAADNYKLIIVARDEQELSDAAAKLKTEHNADVITISKDLFEPDSASEIHAEIAAMGITVDVLVNNAGQGHYGLFVDTELQKQLAIIQLNISSLVSLTHLYLKEMVQRGSGKVLNTSSIAGKVPGPWQAVYHATKAFVQSFTEAIRNEVKEKGITITALLPGATDTDFFNKADMLESKVVQDKDALADAKDVAKDGYEAFKRGDDMVISGWKNKVQVAMSTFTPDTVVAEQMNQQQKPANDKANQ